MLRFQALNFSILFLPWPSILSVDHPVLVDTEFDWYCRDRGGKLWWPGQKIEQECYSYVCNQAQGIKRSWALHVKSHCCSRKGVAYLDGDQIMKMTKNCEETTETCSVEDGAGVIVRTIIHTCCGGDGNRGQEDVPVQWYNFIHIKSNGSFLDIDTEKRLVLEEGSGNKNSQKWRFSNGKLLNKEALGKALGIDSTAKLAMVDEDSDGLLTALAFENGAFQLEDSSYRMQVAGNGDFSWSHNLAKRGAVPVDNNAGDFRQSKADEVLCPELLGWPAFTEMKENPVNTQCWSDIKPYFKLYHGNKIFKIATSSEHLKTIIEPTDIDITSISRLVVLIHGYRANADSWPKEMAQKLAKLSNDLHVLSVD